MQLWVKQARPKVLLIKTFPLCNGTYLISIYRDIDWPGDGDSNQGGGGGTTSTTRRPFRRPVNRPSRPGRGGGGAGGTSGVGPGARKVGPGARQRPAGGGQHGRRRRRGARQVGDVNMVLYS